MTLAPAAGVVVLETRDLSVSFGGLRAVNDVSVAVTQGGITSIIGPNGAGKSTFFNLISGAIRPASGAIFIEGRKAARSPEKLLRQGLARSFQITNLFPQLTVFENLHLAAQILEPTAKGFFPTSRSTRAEAKLEELLARFDLTGHAGALAGELSHGEQRRLEIALALASEPRILLLDEPTQGMSHGDTESTKALIQSLGEHLTVLLIEHDIDLVMDLSKQVIVLHQGTKLAEGTPAAVRANPDVQAAYFGGH